MYIARPKNKHLSKILDCFLKYSNSLENQNSDCKIMAMLSHWISHTPTTLQTMASITKLPLLLEELVRGVHRGGEVENNLFIFGAVGDLQA